MILSENSASSEEFLFFTETGNLYLKQANDIAIRIDLPHLLGIEQKVTACTQLKDNNSGLILLSFSISDKGKNELYVSNALDINKVMDNKKLDINILRRVFVSNVPICKLSMDSKGIFISSNDGELHYCQITKAAAEAFTLIKSNNINTVPRGLAANAVGSSGSEPFDEIIAAKDVFATFISNMVTSVPQIVEAVEDKVIKEGKELFNKLGNEIKTQQQNIEDAFNKPLSYFLQQHANNTPVNTNNINGSVMAFFSPSPTVSNTNNDDSNQMRRFLFKKLELTKGLDVFATSSMPPSISVRNFAQPTAVTTNDQGSDDVVEQLGLLFEKFYTLLDPSKADGLINIDFNKLLDCISGDKPFSSIISDCFNAFKIDDAMNAFFDVLSKGTIHSMLDQMKLADSLKEPIDNGFFETLYKHYFPDKEFNMLELTAFAISILAYVILAAQGKTKEFSDLFANKDYVQHFVGIPENLVKALGGSVNNNRLRLRAAASAPAGAPKWVQELCAGLFSTVLTLWVGVNGVFNFGTGFIASPLTGGFAASIGLCLGGGVHRDFDFTQWKEVVSDLVAGFVGGFAGAFVGGGITRMIAYFWAKNGQLPDARLRKLQMMGIGSSFVFGGGGGAITAVVIKNLIIKGKVDFSDFDWNWVVLTAGAVGGLGGGFMGSGSHFAPPITSGTCLPVPVSLAETQAPGFTQPVINGAIAHLNAATPLPPLNFPAYAAPPGPNPAFMGVYKTELDFGGGVTRRSIALVKSREFTDMDNTYNLAGGVDMRECLFWLYPGGPLGGNVPVGMDGMADLVIGVHGVGRYVFPCISYMTGAGTTADFSRVMTADAFADFLANDGWVTGFLQNIRGVAASIRPITGRSPIIKVSICFSALPPGCCSIGKILTKRLDAITYTGRPGVIPWLVNNQPVVPASGTFLEKILLTRTWNPKWIKYTP